MARVLLVALAWYVVRAEEYGGGAMPQYGGAPDYEHAAPSDEYRGHSPDAPAPLDYKYEEEAQGEIKKPHKYVDEVDRWRKSGKKQRRPTREDAQSELEGKGLDADVDIDPISNRLRSRYRQRDRRERSRRDEVTFPRRHPSRYGRTKHVDDIPDYLDNIDYRDDNDISFERDDRIPLRETTIRVIRRKPRDRLFAPPPLLKGEDIIQDQILNQNEQLKANRRESEKTDDLEYSNGIESDESDLRIRPLLPEPEIIKRNLTKLRGTPKHIAYQDYTDYNMRHFNIRSEIPILPRRTTPSRRRPPPRTSPEELVRALWPARRAGGGGVPPLLADLTVMPNTDPASASTTTTTSMVNTTSPTTATASTNNSTELSLAEKSRLSILKKVKLKERVRDAGTKKPPVLLRVTSRLPTVVMVEPPTSADPWLRAREVAGDSPETLDKVKRLMRQKLVAGAKSIRDLTDDWDDTVCDYIDVSMLKNAGHLRLSLSLSLFFFYLLLYGYDLFWHIYELVL